MSKRQQNNLSLPGFTAQDIFYPTVETYSGGFRQSFGDRSELINRQGISVVHPNAGEDVMMRKCACPCCLEGKDRNGFRHLYCC